MKYLLVISLLPFAINATEKPVEPVVINSDSSATALAKAAAAAKAESKSASNANQSLTVTYKDRLQAPSISAPAVYASGSCTYGKSFGLSIPGGGVSGGKSSPDENCDRREVARVLSALNPALAIKVLCDDPYVKAVVSPDECVIATAPPVVERPDLASKEYVDESVNRAFKKAISK